MPPESEDDLARRLRSEAAAEWASHLPHAVADTTLMEQGGGLRDEIYKLPEYYGEGYHARCTSNDALDSIMYGADDCESITAYHLNIP